ncbi:hypothetical protein D1007_59234 [Hordeum vulgare]|nr:hypothetical protein D1007_59234 [Hordeum vulgare]
MLPFVVPIPWDNRFETAVTGSKPTIIFSFEHGRSNIAAVYSADPTGQRRMVKFHDAFLTSKTMVTYQGNVFVLSLEGTLCKIVWLDGHWYGEPILQTGINCTSVLAVCSGKLLLVKDGLKTIKVFSIDVKRKVLEPIKSLGSSALFLSHGNCMVVDADMLPSIEHDCIYSTFFMAPRFDGIYGWCDLTDGKKSFITAPQVGGDCHGIESGIIHEGPLSPSMALLTVENKFKFQLLARQGFRCRAASGLVPSSNGVVGYDVT